MNAENGVRIRPATDAYTVAVSYTHLDVYKRQLIENDHRLRQAAKSIGQFFKS